MPTTWNPVNWFEIPATDITKSKAFYEAALGVELADMEIGEHGSIAHFEDCAGNRVALHEKP